MIGIILHIVSGIALFVAVMIILRLGSQLKMYENYIRITITSMQTAYVRMKEIDSTGAFEAEDEVGSVFAELADTVYYLRDIVDFTVDESAEDRLLEEVDQIEQE